MVQLVCVIKHKHTNTSAGLLWEDEGGWVSSLEESYKNHEGGKDVLSKKRQMCQLILQNINYFNSTISIEDTCKQTVNIHVLIQQYNL